MMKSSTSIRKSSTTPTTSSITSAAAATRRSRQNDFYEDYSEVCSCTQFNFVLHFFPIKSNRIVISYYACGFYFSFTCYLSSMKCLFFCG